MPGPAITVHRRPTANGRVSSPLLSSSTRLPLYSTCTASKKATRMEKRNNSSITHAIYIFTILSNKSCQRQTTRPLLYLYRKQARRMEQKDRANESAKIHNTPCQDRPSRRIVDQQQKVEYPRLSSPLRHVFRSILLVPQARKQHGWSKEKRVSSHTPYQVYIITILSNKSCQRQTTRPLLYSCTVSKQDGWNKKARQTNRQKYINTPCQDRPSRCTVDQRQTVEYPCLSSPLRHVFRSILLVPQARKQHGWNKEKTVSSHAIYIITILSNKSCQRQTTRPLVYLYRKQARRMEQKGQANESAKIHNTPCQDRPSLCIVDLQQTVEYPRLSSPLRHVFRSILLVPQARKQHGWNKEKTVPSHTPYLLLPSYRTSLVRGKQRVLCCTCTASKQDGWNKKAGQTNRQKYINTPCQDRPSRCIVDQQQKVEYPRLSSPLRHVFRSILLVPQARKQHGWNKEKTVPSHTPYILLPSYRTSLVRGKQRVLCCTCTASKQDG